MPHPETHQKSPLLHWHSLLIYVLLFVLLQLIFNLINFYQPGVLGINSKIAVQDIIEHTNSERQKLGLIPLRENQTLNVAAQSKAQNMFEENYWAHFAPSGKDPWGFILKAGYKFSFAGENLAKNFYTSEEVVKAWMNSASHKENIISDKYEEIGIAVVDGVIQGQKTTLVVQMFGTPFKPLAAAPQVNLGGKKVALKPSEVNKAEPIILAGTKGEIANAKLDPFVTTKVFGLGLFSALSLLLIADFIVLRKRGVFRLSSHHLIHLSFFVILGVAIVSVGVGSIL